MENNKAADLSASGGLAQNSDITRLIAPLIRGQEFLCLYCP